MVKRIIVGDFIAVILLVLGMVILNLSMEKVGTVVYVLLDVLIVVAILFLMNFVINKHGDTKTCIINAVVLVLLYVFISVIYAKTPYGTKATETLNEMSISEEQNYNEDSEMEITFSDADISSQLINYGFYLVAAFVGGKAGIIYKRKKQNHLSLSQ